MQLNELGKVKEYKINIHKSAAFVYTNNKLSERQIKETLPFTTALKRIPRNKATLGDKRPVCRKL